MATELPAFIIEEMTAIYQKLETVQYAVNHWDRPGAGRELDRVRWALGDLIATMTPWPEGDEVEGGAAFTTATERGQ